VLAADTTVELAGELIGKPRDAEDARRILKRLSGNTHRVLTAVAIAFEEGIELALSISEVRFRPLDDDEIGRYVASGEPMDKAGAYGIQGRAGMFIEYLAGSYSGVMGLPLCETAQLLKRFGYQTVSNAFRRSGTPPMASPRQRTHDDIGARCSPSRSPWSTG
jgi:septum formation protein